MFGREFVFADLLSVWDAIFADAYADFLLLEYLMVAMLANIRDRREWWWGRPGADFA